MSQQPFEVVEAGTGWIPHFKDKEMEFWGGEITWPNLWN
jgi:hypothetical protein